MTGKVTNQTKRLYWTDSYKIEFEAKILDITSNELLLDETIFYPSGGGQPSDIGEIVSKENKALIYTVSKVEINDEGKIIHYLSGKNFDKLHINDLIIGRVNWERRYELMKAHTSQHILSAYIEQLFKIKTMKAIIDTQETIVYIEKKISDDDIQKVLSKTNEFLLSGKNIAANFYDKTKIPEEISAHLRGDLNTKEDSEVRIITIDELDFSLCGGTHCKNTTEIGFIVLNDFKGDIIYFSHGNQAVENMSKINVDYIACSKLLATKPLDISKKISKILVEVDDLKDVNISLSKKVAEKQMMDLKANPMIFGDIKIMKENFEFLERKFVLQQLGDLSKNTIAIFIVKGPLLLLLSEISSLPANELIQIYSTETGNKGGGSPKIAQAAITESKRD